MKKLPFLICISFSLLFINKAFSQEDANCGIIVDGVKPESINCWSFEKMDLVFPITDKYKKYERIDVSLYIVPEDADLIETAFLIKFSPESFTDNFGSAKYGVWRILRNKSKDEVKTIQGVPYSRKEFAKYKKGNWCIQFFVTAYVITGYSIDAYGNREANYGNGAILYKSEKVKISTVGMFGKYLENAECTIKGQAWHLNIEKSPTYQDQLGIIK